MTLSPKITITNWDEAPYEEQDGTKLTRAEVTKDYADGVDGTSTTVSLMAYAEDGTASFVGLERITGTVDGRSGSFVLQHVGRYEDGAAKATVAVVPGSGTGQLARATGGGSFLADPEPSIQLDLSFG